MILLGGLLVLWGAVVLGLAPMLHGRWKGMLADLRRAGIKNDLPATRFFASEQGLRWTRLAGGVALAVGIALIVAGLVRGGGLGS